MIWYSMRWKIELFFKVLKSGCDAEKLKLRTAVPRDNYDERKSVD